MLFKRKSPEEKQTVDGYWLFQQGEKSGPFTQNAILTMAANGELDFDAMLKQNGTWTPLSSIDWLPSEAEANKAALENAEQPAETENAGAAGRTAICPHCWHRFRMSQMNYISKHVDLHGDSVLGPEAQQRFLPTSFNTQGYAVDARGLVCQDMACPNCHLKIPEPMIDLPSCFFSIVGAPASGKSYFLTAMTWQLRNVLAKKYDYTLADTDATFNAVLNHYESILFLNRQVDEYVALPKTELQGNDFSNQILLNGMSVDLPLPFIFTLTPMPSNQHHGSGMKNIVFYDNAGEHFEPGRDHANNLATQHLMQSDAITFLYDPIKDARLVTQCDSRDPQVTRLNSGMNQLVLLNEMIVRIKKYTGMRTREKYNKPLIVIIPKYDCWKQSFNLELENREVTYYSESRMKYYFDIGVVTDISFRLREKLLEFSPEVVATCESFFSTVYFIPVSALGRMPEYDRQKDMIAIKPSELHPVWAEVPMLLQFWISGLLDGVAAGEEKYMPVDHYRFMEGSLIYTLPGCKDRDTVPMNYWGRTVFSTKTGQYIRFPDAPETGSVPAPPAGDDDFWT